VDRGGDPPSDQERERGGRGEREAGFFLEKVGDSE